jgi:uncharacterized membrane protein YhaH (DUF805 family)
VDSVPSPQSPGVRSMTDYFESLFISLCIVQFFFPILAMIIRSRFKELGYTMKESPYFSFFNNSGFWSEARNINKQFNDEKINNYIALRNWWWLLAIISFMAIAFS